MQTAFVLSRDPAENARFHVDSDVLSRCLHLAQVLATIHEAEGDSVRGVTVSAFTDLNDPLVLWGRETAANYTWLRRCLHAFLREYQYRWGDAKGQRHAMWGSYEALREPPRGTRARSLEKPFAMTAFPLPSEHPKARYADRDPVELHKMLYANSRGFRPTKTRCYTKREVPAFMSVDPEQ